MMGNHFPLLLLALMTHISQGEIFCFLFLLLRNTMSVLSWSGEGSTVVSKPEEREIAKDTLVATFDQGKTWRISFDFNPGPSWPKGGPVRNIFHFTTGGKGGQGSAFGTRSPSLFLAKHRKNGFQIMSAIDDDPNKQKFIGKNHLPPLNQWTPLVFEQREEVGGGFVFAFIQAGVEKYAVPNNDPKEFANMQVAT